MFDSLQFLENTMNDVYDRIGKRVSNERGRIVAVQQRLGVVKEKLAVVTGSTKTTTVFSPPKYPAPKRYIGQPAALPLPALVFCETGGGLAYHCLTAALPSSATAGWTTLPHCTIRLTPAAKWCTRTTISTMPKW